VKLLLDSHVVLWSLYEPEQLSQRARDLIADQANELFISHITMLEIANKVAARRLPLAGWSVDRMVQRVEELGAALLPITLPDILTAAQLPPHHADPLDRILIVQAQTLDLVFLTRDGDIPKYDVKTIWR
jgi:PIN domain nuclease of toxin-antitoxin system